MRLLWGVGAAAAVAVHPLHTTLTQLSYAAADRTVVVSVRAFADDFRAVAGDVSDSAAFGYLTTVLTLSDPAGRTLPLAWCGARRTGDLLWLCLHAPAPRGLAGLRVDARLLFDRFEDQINIVQASYGGRQVSLLFVRGDHPKPLP